MNLRSLTSLVLAAAAVTGAGGAAAQSRKVIVVPQPARQAPAPGVATFATPNPAGLTPPMPASLNLPGPANISAPGVAPGSPAIDAGIAIPATGSAGVAVVTQTVGGGGTNAMGYGGIPRGPYSAVDIAAAFLGADINHDGELTRAEAARLAIPVPFDDLDRNHDGVLSRFEYEDFFR